MNIAPHASAVADRKTLQTATTGIGRDVAWNLAGQVLPTVVAMATVPLLLRSLGPFRFGVLSFAWLIVGYLSLLDLGVGKALTRLVARAVAEGRRSDLRETVWTGQCIMICLGLFIGAVAFVFAPVASRLALHVPKELEHETTLSFYILASTVPFVIISGALRGVLEGLQRFDLANMVKIPMTIFNFVGPLMVMHAGLPAVVGVVAVGRVIACIVLLILTVNSLCELKEGVCFNRRLVKPLLSFGGWLTVTNLVGPLTASADRFIIGAYLSSAALAYYVTPFELAGRLGILSVSLAAALFPVFSISPASSPEVRVALLRSAFKYLLLLLLPPTVVILCLAPNILSLWLGADFATEAAAAFRWSAVCVFTSSFIQILVAYVQAGGRADTIAWLVLIEVPIVVPAVWWSATTYGIRGAAIAMVARYTCFFLLLLIWTHKRLSRLDLSCWLFVVIPTVAMPALCIIIERYPIHPLTILLLAAGVYPLIWRLVLSKDEQLVFRSSFKRRTEEFVEG